MKKTAMLFLAFLMLAMGSCSKNNDSGDGVDKNANLKGSGDSANDILSNTTYNKLQVQIGYVAGYRPTLEAMAEFDDFLRKHTFKDDIEIGYKELESPNLDNLTLDQIADLEKENRTAYNSGSTLAIYIYFADAPAKTDEEEEGYVTLGAVYRNTSMVIHATTIRSLAAQSNAITVADVEAATLNHEFGHLLGLVDLGTPPVNPGHEDVDAENHCNVAGCLMRAELEFNAPSAKGYNLAKARYEGGITAGCVLTGASVLKLLKSAPTRRSGLTPELGAECVLDLQANGGR